MTINHDDLNFFDILLCSDEEEEEENDEDASIFWAAAGESHHRSSCYVRDQFKCKYHVAKMFKEGPMAFYHQYHMEHGSFMNLCSLIDPFLKVHAEYSQNWIGLIMTEIVVHCLL